MFLSVLKELSIPLSMNGNETLVLRPKKTLLIALSWAEQRQI